MAFQFSFSCITNVFARCVLLNSQVALRRSTIDVIVFEARGLQLIEERMEGYLILRYN